MIEEIKRGENLRQTSRINLIGQIVQILSSFIAVPIVINHVGLQDFGLWISLSAILAVIAFSDFGVGIGLQDSLTKYFESRKYRLAKTILIQAMVLIFLLIFFINAVIYLILSWIDLRDLLAGGEKYSPKFINECMLATMAAFSLGVAASAVNRTFYATCQGYELGVIGVISKIIGPIALVVAANNNATLPIMIIIAGAAQHILLIVIGIVYFITNNKSITQANTIFRFSILAKTMKLLYKTGVNGLGAMISIYIVNSAPVVIIAASYSLGEAGMYGVLSKVYSVLILAYASYMLPYWPAITAALTGGRDKWIVNTYKNLRFQTIALSVMVPVLYILTIMPFARIWLSIEDLTIPLYLIISCGAFISTSLWNTFYTTFLNGYSRYASQAKAGLIMAALFAIIAYGSSIYFESWVPVIIVTFGYFLRCFMMEKELAAIMRSK